MIDYEFNVGQPVTLDRTGRPEPCFVRALSISPISNEPAYCLAFEDGKIFTTVTGRCIVESKYYIPTPDYQTFGTAKPIDGFYRFYDYRGDIIYLKCSDTSLFEQCDGGYFALSKEALSDRFDRVELGCKYQDIHYVEKVNP